MPENYARLFHKKLREILKKRGQVLSDPTKYPKAWSTVIFKEYTRFPNFVLPAANLPDTPLQQVLASRNTTRSFSSAGLSLEELSTLLMFSAGQNTHREPIQQNFLARYYPSGGALYPLEIYLSINNVGGLEPGIYHYNVRQHALEKIGNSALNQDLNKTIAHSIKEAPLFLFISSVWSRNFQKYEDFGYTLALMEAGHLSQNVQLVAETLGLKYCSFAGLDAERAEVILDLKLPDVENIIYCTALGK